MKVHGKIIKLRGFHSYLLPRAQEGAHQVLPTSSPCSLLPLGVSLPHFQEGEDRNDPSYGCVRTEEQIQAPAAV